LLAHIGLGQAAGGGEMGVACRFVTHPEHWAKAIHIEPWEGSRSPLSKRSSWLCA
jgi:hypothetical protein